MYKAKGVLFEYQNIYPKRYLFGFYLWLMFPFLILFMLFVEDRLKNAPESIHNILMLMINLGIILWLPAGIIGAICFRNTVRKIFRYFPKCPQEFRHNVTAEFDFTSKPVGVGCKIISQYERTGYYVKLGTIKYDDATKILVFSWLSKFPESRRLRGRYRHSEPAYVVIPAPYSEELMNLIHENKIEGIESFDTEMANYVAKALKE